MMRARPVIGWSLLGAAAALLLAAFPTGAQAPTQGPGYECSDPPRYDYDQDCVPDAYDRTHTSFVDVRFPTEVWQDETFEITGRLVTNETYIDSGGVRHDVDVGHPVFNATIVANALPYRHGSANFIIGAGFTDATGTFKLSATMRGPHSIVVPQGLFFLERLAIDGPTTVAWQLNTRLVPIGEVPLTVWAFNTSATVDPGDPTYYDFQAYDDQSQRQHPSRSIEGAVRVFPKGSGFTIRSNTTVTIQSVDEIVRGDNLTVTGNLYDTLGNGLKNQPLQALSLDDSQWVVSQTGVGGVAEFKLHVVEAVPPGPKTVTLRFHPTSPVLTDSEAHKIVLVRYPTHLQLSTSTLTTVAGDQIQIIGRLLDARGLAMVGQRVDLSFLGKQFATVQTNSGGSFVQAFSTPEDLQAGNYTIHGDYAGSDNRYFLPTFAETSSILVKRQTWIRFESERRANATTDVFRETETVIRGVLSDQDAWELVPGHVLLGNIRLRFTFAGEPLPGVVTVGPQGEFFVRVFARSDQSLGLVHLEASFAGSTFYLPSTHTIPVRIAAHTSIQATNIDQAFRGQPVTVRGTLADDLNDELPDQALSFFWNNTLLIGELQTDANGEFAFRYIVPESMRLGLHTVRIGFAGSKDLIYKPTNQTVPVGVYARSQVLMEPKVLHRGPATLEGLIKDELGAPLVGVVRAQFENKYVGNTSFSTAHGEFVFAFSIPMNTPVGKKMVQVEFSSSNPYVLPSKSSVSMTLKAVTSLSISNRFEAVRGLPLSLEGRLDEDNGVGLEEAPVLVHLGNLSLPSILVEKGEFRWSQVTPKIARGLYVLSLNYTGAEFHEPTTLNLSIPVKSSTRLVLNVPPAAEKDTNFQGNISLVDDEDVVVANVTMCLQAHVEARVYDPFCVEANYKGFALFHDTYRGDGVDPMRYAAVYNGSAFLTPAQLGGSIIWPSPPSHLMAWIIATSATVIVALGVFAAFLYARRRRSALERIKDVVADIVYELTIRSADHKVIIDTYRKLEQILQMNGYLRKKYESAREFSRALLKALPLPERLVEDLVELFELARYSENPVDAKLRDRAIETFTALDKELQRIFATQRQQAAAAQPSKASRGSRTGKRTPRRTSPQP